MTTSQGGAATISAPGAIGSLAAACATDRRATAALTLASAWTWAACFEQRALLLVPWLALVPWLMPVFYAGSGACSDRFVVVLGWLHGIIFWWLSIPWIAPTLTQFGGLPTPLAWLLTTLLAAYLGAFHALFVLLLRRFLRVGIGWWTAPGLWVLLDWARETILSGFPWNLAGYSVIEVPGVLQSSHLLGAVGWSALVLLVNCALAMAWARGAPRRQLVAAGGVLAGVVLLLVAARLSVGGSAASRGIASDPAEQGPLMVRLVQPNQGIDMEIAPAEILANYAELFELSRCDEPGTLIVWPESAAFPYVWERDAALRRDVHALVASGCPVLLNSSRREGDATYNTALLVGTDGVVQRYDKNHLVPFGEFVPLARLLPFVGQLARNAGAFNHGESLELLNLGDLVLGVSICFEITFAGEVSQRARGGANVLVTVTNDAWYGDSSAPWQHLRAARFRAAENRRVVLRAAITGVSAVIDPFGGLEQHLALDRLGVLRARPVPNNRLTPWSRFPRWVECTALLAITFAALRRRFSHAHGSA